jgi:hypothetical protein
MITQKYDTFVNFCVLREKLSINTWLIISRLSSMNEGIDTSNRRLGIFIRLAQTLIA